MTCSLHATRCAWSPRGFCVAPAGLYLGIGTNSQGLRPGLSCVAAPRLGIPSPEGAKQKSPGREPWVHAKRQLEPCRGDAFLLFVSNATESVQGPGHDAAL